MLSNNSTTNMVVGTQMLFLSECRSTNDSLAELVKEGNNYAPAEGTVLYTHNQTAGRGQRGNTWQASAGENLTFSVLLRPHFLLPKQQFQLSVMVALALREAVAELLPAETEVKVKWPNDILVNQKKIAGVLIENAVTKDRIGHSIIGIGLNVNQLVFSSEIEATSLSLILKANQELGQVLHLLLKKLDAYYLRLRSNNGYPELLANYYANLFNFNVERIYQDSLGYLFSGTIIGIDEYGKLQLLIEGEMKSFDIKEISLVG